MFRHTLSEFRLSRDGPRPSYRPTVEALEERVALSTLTDILSSITTSGAISKRQFNGAYQATFTGPVTVLGVSQQVNVSRQFRITNGHIFAANGQMLGTITSRGDVNINLTFQGVVVNVQGHAKIVHHIPSASGTWTVLSQGISGGGIWNAVRISK